MSQLMPAPYNPRASLKPGDPAFEKLKRSLKEFDLVQPIVWNRQSGHVVGGHQRLEVLKHEGITAVACVVVDLDAAREKALNVALNNQELASDWDPGKLKHLIDDLCALPDFDATLTGFDAQQLRDLMFVPEPLGMDEVTREEAAPEHVTAQLEIPYLRWAAVRPHLDTLLATEPTIRLHVQLPQGCS
ncbi:MAG: ParB N-terminal domain-containing protein [Planctomycetaceae bacterium]